MRLRSGTGSLTPRLSDYARAFVYPDGIVRTVWPRVEAKGRELGIEFDWWQSQLGSVCLGYGADGLYVATVGGIGLSIPRQVGKTFFVMATLVIMCVLFPGLQVVWTSHHLRTTTRTLTAIQGMARRRKVAPHVRTVRTSHGEGQVEFVNGSVIMFGARSQGFGRGFDVIDVEVFDEAQILDTKALEDMVAATNQARHPYGALLFFMGTPPRPTDPSDAFRQRREEALAGEAPDAVWLEIGADPESDPDDEDQWPLMNPSYPARTSRTAILRLRKNLKDDDSWNREGRGIWDPTHEPRVLPAVAWNQAADRASMAVERLTLGITVLPDRSMASVALAGLRADGCWHVELDERKPGTDWVVDWVRRRAARNRLHGIVVDEVAGLTERRGSRHVLKGTRLGVTVAGAEGREMAVAWAKFHDGVVAGEVKHLDQPQVNEAVGAAATKDFGVGKVLSQRRSGADITPLSSMVAALWGAQQAPGRVRRPGDGSERGGRRKVVVLT